MNTIFIEDKIKEFIKELNLNQKGQYLVTINYGDVKVEEIDLDGKTVKELELENEWLQEEVKDLKKENEELQETIDELQETIDNWDINND